MEGTHSIKNIDSINTDRLRIATFNVNGLKNKFKRRSIFNNLKKQNLYIYGLQETYLASADITSLEKEIGCTIHASNATGRSKGILTVFNKSIPSNATSCLTKSDRFLLSKICLNNEEFYILNVYAPNKDNEKLIFLNDLSYLIKKYIPEEFFNNIICFGDLNMVMSNDLDIISGAPHSSRVIDQFKYTMEKFNFTDIWRLNNPKIKKLHME